MAARGFAEFVAFDLNSVEELLAPSPLGVGRQPSPSTTSSRSSPIVAGLPRSPRLSSPLVAAGLHARRRTFAIDDDDDDEIDDDEIAFIDETTRAAEEAIAAAAAASAAAACAAENFRAASRSASSSRSASPASAAREFVLQERLARAEAEAAGLRAEAAAAAHRCERLERVAMDAMLERDDALDELESTRAMLQDAMLHIDALRRRLVDGDLENMMLRANHRPPRTAAASDGVFGLTKTKEAIEKAVKDACALPEAERRKKINALRLKWHPDKHEVLGEMAEEVTKLINEAVERHGGS